MLIKNAKVFTPRGLAAWLSIEGDQIVAVGRGHVPTTSGPVIDAQGLNVLPGFIDIHIHGSAGTDVMDATPAALITMAEFLAQQGVTSFLPTTLTNPHPLIMQALENVKRLMGQEVTGAAILGAHLEGPYLNAEKCGAQNPQYIRRPTPAEIDDLLGVGVLRLVDVAPEFPENQALIAACAERGITVSVAHSAATYAQTLAAVEQGLSHSTHTFNAQTPLLHREPGIVGAVLSTPHIAAEVIADGIHVHPAVLNLLWRCKQPHHLILISDAVRPAGMPPGEYAFDERMVLLKDGAVRLPDGTLAGSVLTLDRALFNLMQATGESLAALWPTSSLNAARAIGVAAQRGSLEVGKSADVVVVDDTIQVHMTLVQGKVVYQR
jgi:N-acetylglucosamine-6-phosphate deacetylase